MRNINIAICDDDTFFASELKTKIENLLLTFTSDMVFTIDTFHSGKELLKNYSDKYSICFLDICINDENGITMGIELKNKFPETILVFVTSFIDFSLDGYKAKAFRYLLKNSLDNLLPECIKDILNQLSMDNSIIELNTYGKRISIKTNSIIFIESFRHNQVVHLSNGKLVECNMTLNDLENQTKELLFIKPHKSYLVNIKYISCLKNYTILLTDGSTIPIARNKYAEFKMKYLLGLSKL